MPIATPTPSPTQRPELERRVDGNTVEVVARHVQRVVFDDVVILPQYERGYIYTQHKEIEGVRRSITGGDTNFNYARIRDLGQGGSE